MKLDFMKRAQRDALRIHARWDEHAEHKETFAKELLETLQHLISVGSPGAPCPTAKRPALRRMLMPKSECHVYFEVDQRRQVVRVLTVDLLERIRLAGIPSWAYTIGAHSTDDGYVVRSERNKWLVYHMERGLPDVEREFETEEEAYDRMWRLLSADEGLR